MLKSLLTLAAAAVVVAADESAAVDASGKTETVDKCEHPWEAVTKRVVAADVVEHGKEYCPDTHRKFFKARTLGYVTPWNNHGYDVAKTFGGKLDIVSPVWVQVRPVPNSPDCMLEGLHDADAGWLAEVRGNACNSSAAGAACPLILPRVAWEAPGFTDRYSSQATSKLVSMVTSHPFDGVVLEGPMEPPFVPIIKRIASALHKRGKTFVLVIPPRVTQAMFLDLADHVDAFSLMTYDYSSSKRANGANAPIAWVRSTVTGLVEGVTEEPRRSQLLSKILLGLAFYGYENTSPVLANRYLAILEVYNPKIKLDPVTQEHHFKYADAAQGGAEKLVHYPTKYSILQRIKLAEELGTGLSIWELGQGLDSFMDLL